MSKTIEKRKEELEKQLKELGKKEEEFKNTDSFTLSTNSAYILNMKVFEGWTDFTQFMEVKHEQHWEGMYESTVEVTFKLKKKKKSRKK